MSAVQSAICLPSPLCCYKQPLLSETERCRKIQGKAFLLIFLHGLICKERGRVSSRQAGEQDGVSTNKPSLMVLLSLAPWPREVMWVLGLSGTAQQPSGINCPMSCAPPSPRWGRDSSSTILLASYLWVLGLGHPIARMHQKQFDLSAMETHGGQAGKETTEMLTQTSSNSALIPGCSCKQCPHGMASTAPQALCLCSWVFLIQLCPVLLYQARPRLDLALCIWDYPLPLGGLHWSGVPGNTWEGRDEWKCGSHLSNGYLAAVKVPCPGLTLCVLEAVTGSGCSAAPLG